MKKIIILVTGVLLFLTNYSQNPLGFSIGSNFSYLTTDSSSLPIKYGKPGIYGGMFLNVPSGYKSYVEVGAFLSQQGAQFKSISFFNNPTTLKTEKNTYTINNTIYYIKLPLNWKQSFGDWYTKLGFYGEIAAYKYSKWTKNHEYLDTNIFEEGIYNSFATNLRMYDMGLSLAMGVEFSISPKYNFFINAEYNIGFLNLTPDEIRPENKMYNRFFTISTGIILNKTKYKYRRR